jgi:shikimate kinase
MSSKSQEEDSDVDVKIAITASQMIYETSKVCVYKDEKDAIVVVNPQKQIILTRGGKLPYNENNFQQISTFQKMMLENSIMKLCKTVEVDGKELKEVTLVPQKELQKSSKIKELIFTYDPKRNTLYQTETHYMPGGMVEKEKIIYYIIDFHYKGTLPEKVIDKVFTSSGKLQGKYKGYKVVDQR